MAETDYELINSWANVDEAATNRPYFVTMISGTSADRSAYDVYRVRATEPNRPVVLRDTFGGEVYMTTAPTSGTGTAEFIKPSAPGYIKYVLDMAGNVMVTPVTSKSGVWADVIPSTGIPVTDMSEGVQDALEAAGSAVQPEEMDEAIAEALSDFTPSEGGNTVIVELVYFDGNEIASMTSTEIAEALESANLNVILIDLAKRRCNMVKAPDENDDPVVAKFSTLDENGDQLIYTVYANGVTETQTIERGTDGPVVPVQPSAGGTQRIWYFDSWQDAQAWNADPANANNQVQAGDYLYMPYIDGLQSVTRLYRVTGDSSAPLETVRSGAGEFIISVHNAGLGPVTNATLAQVQAAYAEKKSIRMFTEDRILLAPNNAEWGVVNGRPVPTKVYFSTQNVTPTGPVLKSYILDAYGLKYQERDVGRLLGIKRLFVTGTEGQGGVITYALDNPASDFGYGETIDYNKMVGMAIDGADIRMAVRTGLSDWMEYHLVQGGLGGTPPSLLFLGAQTDGNVIRLQMFMLTAMNDVYEVNVFAGPYIPKPQAAHVGYTLIANAQGGFSLTLPEAAAGSDGLSPQVKNALLQFAQAVVYEAQNAAAAQAVYQNLYNALYPQSEPAELVSISAVYTQGGATVYDNASLDSLKASLVVTAHYDDNTSEAVQGYTLSGTLTAGTSTVTVTYEGLTTTFSVTVTQHDPLDEIAYGNLTYREMFVQNNLAYLNDFEGNISLSETPVTFAEDSTYEIGAGTPTLTTEEFNSPTHSLKCFGSGSNLAIKIQRAIPAGYYLLAISAKCVRCASGYLGVQANTSVGSQTNLVVTSVNNAFEPKATVLNLAGGSDYLRLYVGSYHSADLDGYIDDLVCTLLPSGMTDSQALALYNQYLSIVKGAQS